MTQGAHHEETPRVRDARLRAVQRSARQRGWFRPLGVGLMAIVVAEIADGRPGPSAHGSGLWLTVTLVVWVAALGAMLVPRGPEGTAQLALIVLIGAAGVAIAALQHHGATEIPASVAVWLAVMRLPRGVALGLGLAVTAGVAVAFALNSTGSGSIAAAVLLCALLGVMAQAMRQARESQDRAEWLLAQLEDAREEQAKAAAVAERGRIAGELHDVLAHSLSGAAIQLQGARMLAEREDAAAPVREAIDRGSELVRVGLIEARRAVATLRGGELPGVGDISSLVTRFAGDMHVRAELRIEGAERPLSADAGLAVYRAAQEALTNAARYAPGADVLVRLRYGEHATALTIENRRSPGARPPRAPLTELGGGHGLEGMRRRVEDLGGRMSAGPRDGGWMVELELPP